MQEMQEGLKPVVFDLFCGLGGWSESFIEAGYRAIGFDIEAHDYGKGGYPGELVLRDIRSINGADLVKQYGVPAVIVASPPCQEFSYMAMPWSKAKEKRKKILASEAEKKRLCELFNECFRIQREISAAAGCYVPMVVENVRGAQEWVGRSNYNFGSFHLWGDVPALMPQPKRGNVGATKLPVGNATSPMWNERPIKRLGDALKSEGNKTVGMNWSDQSKRGQDFTRITGQQADGVKVASETGGRTDKGKGARFTSRDCGAEGIKTGGDWWDMECRKTSSAQFGSKSKARKEASALIAKIPPVLASWIAWTFKPK